MSLRTDRSVFEVLNPATGEVFGEAPDCSREELDATFAAATEAQLAWARDPAGREATMVAAADELKGAAQEIVPILVAEQGKPVREAFEEVMGARWWIRHHAKLRFADEVIQDDERAHVRVVHKPVGVVAAITPWNFPLILAAWKIGPALAAGCTMVLKPSPFTPLSTIAMVDALNRHLPAGVLTVVTGGNDLGAWMTTHPVPRKVSFTGSIATGKRIAVAVADDLKRLTLELGGNDAAILLDDADPEAVARGVFAGAFYNAGQVCCAVKRVYAPERLYDQVVDALAAQASKVVVGDGASDGTQMGPINNAAQLERVTELTAAALADGAVAAAGGGPLAGDGYFFAPTVLSGARDGMRIVDEEQFGPVLPVIPYRDEEAALAAANATHYGLSGSVWGTDADRATELAGRLDCGTAWVNTHLANAPYQPFGGRKWSGVGVENGLWGMAGYTEPQVIHRARGT